MCHVLRPLRFHVLYWEPDLGGADKAEPEPGLGASAGTGPRICSSCRGVAEAWRWRLDNFQTCVRMCGKEGCGFRREIANITCMGPGLRIQYEPAIFYRYLTEVRSRALTEETVIGTALEVRSGVLDPQRAGVEVEELKADAWQASLAKSAAKIRGSTAARP